MAFTTEYPILKQKHKHGRSKPRIWVLRRALITALILSHIQPLLYVFCTSSWVTRLLRLVFPPPHLKYWLSGRKANKLFMVKICNLKVL